MRLPSLTSPQKRSALSSCSPQMQMIFQTVELAFNPKLHEATQFLLKPPQHTCLWPKPHTPITQPGTVLVPPEQASPQSSHHGPYRALIGQRDTAASNVYKGENSCGWLALIWSSAFSTKPLYGPLAAWREVWRVFLYSSRTTGEQLWLLLIFCCVPTCCVARGAAASCSNALCCFLLYQFQSTPAVSGFILFFFSLKEKQPPTCSLTLSYRTLFFLFSGLVLPRGDQSFSLPRHALRHLLRFVGWGWSCFCEQCSRGPCLYSHLILSFWFIWWLSHTDASCFFSHI